MPPERPARPGRPRDTRRDEEILAAVLRLLEDSSYADLSIAAIARSAGVGKPTLYLRWPSKASVVADAVVRVLSPDPFPDLGDVRSDLVAGLRSLADKLTGTLAGRVLPALVADLRSDAELSAAFHQRYFEPRRQSLQAALRRGIERGELAAGIDLDLVADALVGPVYYRLLTRPGPPEVAPESVADLVLRACRP